MSAASARGRSREARELEPYLAARLGPEPLGPLSAAGSAGRLEGRRAPLKSALLDQRTIAGLGNIYVDEALWRARLHPLRMAGSLDDGSSRACTVRSAACSERASSVRERRCVTTPPDGAYGTMQDEFRAYGRGGEPCDRCRATITKTRVGGRGTWFCPRCQE